MLMYNKLLQYWQRKAASLLPPILDNFGARRIFLIAYTFGLGDDSKFASFPGGRGFNLTWFFGSNWVHALNDISSGSGVLLCLCIAVLLRDSLGCKDRCANINFLTYFLLTVFFCVATVSLWIWIYIYYTSCIVPNRHAQTHTNHAIFSHARYVVYFTFCTIAILTGLNAVR